MKKLVMFSILTFMLSQMSFSQEFGWKVISPESIPESPDFSGVFFTNKDVGWFTVSNPFSLQQIYKTNDGGTTFTTQSTPFTTKAVQMINADIGYAVGFSPDVLKTTNGGTDWSSMGTSSSDGLYDISFPLNTDPNNPVGYTGGNMSLYRVDTNVSNLGPPYAGTYKKVSAPSGNCLWICLKTTILKYTDDAYTEPETPSGVFNDIHFVTNEEGWVVGENDFIMHTSDGGASWNVQDVPFAGSDFNCVFFLDLNEGWVVGRNGKILHTTNGGEEWIIEASGLTNSTLTGVYFTSSDNGYVVGYDETLLKYTEVSGVDDNLSNLQFELYPNPAADKFKVQSLLFKVSGAALALFGVDGRKLLEKTIPKGSEEISVDVHSLQSGVYLFRVTVGNKSVTKKLMIQK
jgi:photosystem II stability/assembly factor-like uncharacterized protein